MPPTKRQDDAPFRIGELVQVEIAGDWLFEQPQPIRRIETGPDGARWYFFAGSTSGLPEHCLRAIESQKPDRVAGVDHFSERTGKREPFCRFPFARRVPWKGAALSGPAPFRFPPLPGPGTRARNRKPWR